MDWLPTGRQELVQTGQGVLQRGLAKHKQGFGELFFHISTIRHAARIPDPNVLNHAEIWACWFRLAPVRVCA